MNRMKKNSYWVFEGDDYLAYSGFIPNKIYIGNVISEESKSLHFYKNEDNICVYYPKKYFRELTEGECIYCILESETNGIEYREVIVSMSTDFEQIQKERIGYICCDDCNGFKIEYHVIKYAVKFNSDKSLLVKYENF